jgi:hypothetical protein
MRRYISDGAKRRKAMQIFFQKLFSMILLTAVLTGAFTVRANTDFLFGDFGVVFTNTDADAPQPEVQLPNCPDANGEVRGTGKLLTAQSATEVEITGYVTDAAELSHFDMTGATSETLTGGGRTKRISVSIEKSALGASQTADRLGKITFGEADSQMAGILKTEANAAVKTIFERAAGQFRAAREKWRGGACVEVKLTAAKTKLMAGEKIGVTAESLQRQDKTAINALLTVKNAVAVAAPSSQQGTPRANFTLTAPVRDANASITVESVSKRGIGLGKLEFPVSARPIVKKPPVKKDTPPVIIIKKPPTTKKPSKEPTRCKPANNWKGVISVKTYGKRELPAGQTGAGGGRLQYALVYREKSYQIDYKLSGERDLSGGFANAVFADANVSYLERYYRTFTYVPAYCGTTRIAQLKTEFLNRSEAKGDGRATIFISAYTRSASFQFAAPKAVGGKFYDQLHFSGCPQQDGINTFTRDDGKFEWQFKGLLFEFENESADAGVLKGAKTIQNSDGTETTVTWDLVCDCT